MKKIAVLLLIGTLLILLLTGCSKDSPVGDAADIPANFEPETTTEPVAENTEETLPEAVDLPLEQPQTELTPAEPVQDEIQPTQAPINTTHAYTLTALNDTSFGFVLAYPSGWQNLPGKHTICFREQVEDGDFPARVAVTKKTFAHTPSSDKVLSQFQSYAQTIYAQYDPNTFEFGALNSNAKFLGQPAHEISYLAYSGDTEVKGYMICCSVRHDMYVFHFYSSYDDFAPMETMMKQIRDTVTIID